MSAHLRLRVRLAIGSDVVDLAGGEAAGLNGVGSETRLARAASSSVVPSIVTSIVPGVVTSIVTSIVPAPVPSVVASPVAAPILPLNDEIAARHPVRDPMSRRGLGNGGQTHQGQHCSLHQHLGRVELGSELCKFGFGRSRLDRTDAVGWF